MQQMSAMLKPRLTTLATFDYSEQKVLRKMYDSMIAHLTTASMN